jgi:uncharacterized membrane protein
MQQHSLKTDGFWIGIESAQILKGHNAAEKDVGSVDGQVSDPRESPEGVAAAASHPMNLDSEQTSRDDGSSTNKHSQKLLTSKPPSKVSGRQHHSLSVASVAGGTQQVINEEDLDSQLKPKATPELVPQQPRNDRKSVEKPEATEPIMDFHDKKKQDRQEASIMLAAQKMFAHDLSGGGIASTPDRSRQHSPRQLLTEMDDIGDSLLTQSPKSWKKLKVQFTEFSPPAAATPLDNEAYQQLAQGLASKSVPCPVCKLLVECDDAATVNFAEAFGDKGTKRKGKDAKDSKDAKSAKLKGGSSRGPGSAKLGIAFRLHVSNFHLQEPVWNALPRMDLASADEPCSSKRTKNTNATLAGLVAYGLAYAGRRVPLRFDLADDWHKMQTLMILKVGYAVSEVGHAEVFFKGRTNVVGVPPSLHKQGDQRSWLKKMACEYLMRLSDAIMRASPSAVWLTESSPARKRNAHQIFFLSRGCHLDCPALIKYHSDDLTKTNILRVLDPLLESSASELATGDNDLTEAVVPVDPVALF